MTRRERIRASLPGRHPTHRNVEDAMGDQIAAMDDEMRRLEAELQESVARGKALLARAERLIEEGS